MIMIDIAIEDTTIVIDVSIDANILNCDWYIN
jgi:hypothetical protein